MVQLADLKPADFESDASYTEFVATIMSMPDESQRERMCSIVGRPSQFVGPVRSLQAAIEHWKQWDAWDKAEKLRLAQVRRFLKDSDDSAPVPEMTAAQSELDDLNTVWRGAVTWAKDNKAQWDEWRKQEYERIRTAYEEAELSRERHVKNARDAYRAAKNKN